MSKNVRVSAHLLGQVMAEMLGAACAGGLSERLGDAALTVGDSGGLGAALEVLREPGVADLAARFGLGAAHCAVIGESAGLEPHARLAQTAGLLSTLGEKLGRAERDAVAGLATGVLSDRLGYAVCSEAGDVATGIEAYLGDEVFLVAVMDGGELLVDQAGAADCAATMAAFEAEMQSAGVLLSRIAESPHDPDQGPLIARAAATMEPSLAAGIARHSTRGVTRPSLGSREGNVRNVRGGAIEIEVAAR